MAKGILKFDLENLDDMQEFKRCLKASDMAGVIWEYLRNSRKTIEQEFENKTEGIDVFDGIGCCFEHFYSLLEKNSINIDDLYN